MELKIKKNRHYHSNWIFRMQNLLARGISEYTVVFLEGTWYKKINKDSEDWNKVHGIKGWKAWKKNRNEACIVCKPAFDNQDKIEVGFYGRENGKIWDKEIGEFDKFTPYHSKVEIINDGKRKGYFYKWGSFEYFWSHSNPEGDLSMQFYHGGDNKSSQKMSLKLN